MSDTALRREPIFGGDAVQICKNEVLLSGRGLEAGGSAESVEILSRQSA